MRTLGGVHHTRKSCKTKLAVGQEGSAKGLVLGQAPTVAVGMVPTLAEGAVGQRAVAAT